MVRALKVVLVTCAVAVALLAGSADGWAQTPTQPPVAFRGFDLIASVPFTESAEGAGAKRTWTGPGFLVTVDANVGEHLAVATSIEKRTPAGAAALAGLQLSTGFFYGSNRDPVPGRFFAKLLAGAAAGGSNAAHAAGQIDVGADVLLSRCGCVAFRWEIGYDVAPGDEHHPAAGRAAFGIVLGRRS